MIVKPTNIFVDADSFPSKLVRLCINEAIRLNIPLYWVANRAWPHSSVHPLIKPILSTLTPESSDNYIITQSKAGDIVLTLDLILTQKLVHKEVCVINHKGATFTKHTIAARLIERNLMYTIAQADKSLRGSKKREESLDIEPFLGTLLAHLRKAKLQKGS